MLTLLVARNCVLYKMHGSELERFGFRGELSNFIVVIAIKYGTSLFQKCAPSQFLEQPEGENSFSKILNILNTRLFSGRAERRPGKGITDGDLLSSPQKRIQLRIGHETLKAYPVGSGHNS